MAIDFETSESTEMGAKFLEEEGTYHVMVIHTDEAPTIRSGNRKGEYLDGFEVEVEVIAGDQAKKTHRLMFNNPNLSHKDGGDFARRLQTRFLEVVGLIDPTQKGKRVSVELKTAETRQFIAAFKNREKDGKTYLQLDGGKFWHIDDPSADKCERDQLAIDKLAGAYRRDPKSFETAKPATNGNGSASKSNGNGNGQSSPKPTVDPNEL